MNVDSFLDTNILVYAAAGKGSDEAKRQRALTLVEEGNFGLSAQVMQEFYVTVCRKIERPLSAEQALEWIEQLEVFPCIAIDTSLVKNNRGQTTVSVCHWSLNTSSIGSILGLNIFYEVLIVGHRPGYPRFA